MKKNKLKISDLEKALNLVLILLQISTNKDEYEKLVAWRKVMIKDLNILRGL